MDPFRSSYALIIKASAPSFTSDSKLEVRNDRPELATKIAYRIEVFPDPFFP